MKLKIRMKNILCSCHEITLVALLFVWGTAYSQVNYADDALTIVIEDSSAHAGSETLTNNASLNALFASYNVDKYYQLMGFANSDYLKRVYRLTCNSCDEAALMQELDSNYTSIITDSWIPYSQDSLLSEYHPSDGLYQTTIDGTHPDWMWHLPKIEASKAWGITWGNPNVTIAILDTYFDLSHPDLSTQAVVNYDAYEDYLHNLDPNTHPAATVFSCLNTANYSGYGVTFMKHGTVVAACATAETNNLYNNSQGLASIGFQTRFYPFLGATLSGSLLVDEYVAKAIYASTVLGVDVITSSVIKITTCPENASELEIYKSATEEIISNNTTIVLPGGNDYHPCWSCDNPTYNVYCPGYSTNNGEWSFFPFSSYIDDRIIVVSGSDINDNHTSNDPNVQTFTTYDAIDICAPGYKIMSATATECGANQWPYYGDHSGTSFSAPIVAGVTALMYSVNPCLNQELSEDILKNTTDPIADAHLYPGGVGTGRVNAYNAVKFAKLSNSQTLDLYIKDRLEDFGVEHYGYNWQLDRDDSPDIWVRNQPDGIQFQSHQNPQYNQGSPLYVYVKVRNKSCVTSTGTEKLKLYWSKSSSWSSWPSNWDGSDPTIGDVIGNLSIPILQPGESTILEFQWNVLNPSVFDNWNTCLLARIENSSADPITIHPNRLDDDVFFNNNIAMKNLIIKDFSEGSTGPGFINGKYYTNGSYMFVGNTESVTKNYDLTFIAHKDLEHNPFTDQGEVKLIFDDNDWGIFASHFSGLSGVEVVSTGEVIITTDTVKLTNVNFGPLERVPIYVGFEFLVDKSDSQNVFDYNVRQYDDTSLLGGVHFNILRDSAEQFTAEASASSTTINYGESTILSATSSVSGEPNWSDNSGNSIGSSYSQSVLPLSSQRYQLEFRSNGYKKYDSVTVEVVENWISSVSPNPASQMINVQYQINQGMNSELRIFDQMGNLHISQVINSSQSTQVINVGGLNQGIYELILVVDGSEFDSESILIQ